MAASRGGPSCAWLLAAIETHGSPHPTIMGSQPLVENSSLRWVSAALPNFSLYAENTSDIRTPLTHAWSQGSDGPVRYNRRSLPWASGQREVLRPGFRPPCCGHLRLARPFRPRRRWLRVWPRSRRIGPQCQSHKLARPHARRSASISTKVQSAIIPAWDNIWPSPSEIPRMGAASLSARAHAHWGSMY